MNWDSVLGPKNINIYVVKSFHAMTIIYRCVDFSVNIKLKYFN